MLEWHFCYSAQTLPGLLADQTDTLAEELAHQIPRIVVLGFGMLVGISKNGLYVMRLSKNSAIHKH
jgi:hypothetical protein